MKKIIALMNQGPEFNYEIERFSRRDDVLFHCVRETEQDKVIETVKDAEVILFTDVSLNKEVIDSLEKCKLIIRYGIGYDNVDIKRAAERGIIVCNAPNYGVVDVAEHAMSLILACAKRLVYMNDCVRNNFWNINAMGSSSRLAGKTIGFVGFGKIARCVCERANAFQTKAIVYDPYINTECLKEYSAESVSLDELLGRADYVSLHLPLSDRTHRMFGEKEFMKMKKSAYLINTSRGALINEPELLEALEKGVIAGAGLDVFEDESGNIDKRFFYMENVILTPHVAWNTIEAKEALHKEVTDNVIRFLNGESPESIVNLL